MFRVAAAFLTNSRGEGVEKSVNARLATEAPGGVVA
jgi:hypothetical protein